MKYIPSPAALRLLQRAVRGQSLHRTHQHVPVLRMARHFHAAARLDRIETHTLSDIGEGVKEVQVIQWFVEEGAPIEEWSPLCEVQSDKASVEITSKYTGVIKKIYFPQDAVIQVGDAMLDIEVEGDADADEATGGSDSAAAEGDAAGAEQATEQQQQQDTAEPAPPAPETPTPTPTPAPAPKERGPHASLATPAVRGLLKQHGLAVEDISGTGKDGRVLKEDVYKHIESGGAASSTSPSTSSSTAAAAKPAADAPQVETAQRLTPIQSAMFKSMTASLAIPHFLYSDSVEITSLAGMRTRLNATRAPDALKLSYMPFIIKAVSLALHAHPLLNARLDLASSPTKPQLVMRARHNIGVAMDTPAGLLVPVVKNVDALSVRDIAVELDRLAQLGKAGKLSTADLSGGTITVSNIGNIGGEVLAPVLVEGQLAIMGVGKIKEVPVFADDGSIRKALQVNVSWSADHRVVDGATMARAAKVVQGYLEEPARMILELS